MPYAELFGWWIATITWSIAFPIVVSVYLYRHREVNLESKAGKGSRWVKDFAFVWFLLALLAFYVLVVGQGSALLFALGNIVVEAMLLLYVLRVARREDGAAPNDDHNRVLKDEGLEMGLGKQEAESQS